MSKVKLVVEVDKKRLETAKEYDRQGRSTMLEKAIANGIPYNPSGDLINREALKKQFEDRTLEDFNCYHFIEAINNAPTVEPICPYLSDNEVKQPCLNSPCERPQGNWKTVEGVDGDEYYECSNCGEPWVLTAGTPKENNMNFCPNCGADMRGANNG